MTFYRNIAGTLWVLYFILGCVRCGFFDLSDLDDPFSLIWSNKETWLQQPIDSTCIATRKNGLKLPGVCQKTSKCFLSGGTPSGLCGGLLTCCTYDSICGKSTKAKVSYFDNGDKFDNLNECQYTVQLANSNVCQIRLDFETFDILPATRSADNTRIICKDEKLIISPNNYGIPDLCGHNTGQHVYIHINQTEGETGDVTLKFNFKERTDNPATVAPKWKIKVTQLECPGYDKNNWIHHDTKQAVIDFPALAPVGAIQYFTDLNGYIRSFGYDPVTRKNSFTTGEKYAIAFRRRRYACGGVRFTKTYFNLHHATSTTIPPADAECKDYLFVPGLQITNPPDSVTVSRVCGTNADLKQLVFDATPPGPMYVYFTSAETYDPADEPNPKSTWAFNIKYNVFQGC